MNVVKGTTVKKDLELLSRAIAIARAEWAIHMAANPASGRRVKRPEPQDGDVRDQRLADAHVVVKAIAQLAAYPADGRTPPTRPGPKSRRTRPEEDYEAGPDTAALLAMPQSDQQALLRACRYPSWYTRRKRDVTLAATQIPPPMATSDSPTLTMLR